MGNQVVDTEKTTQRITDTLPKTASPEQLKKIAEILGVQVEYLPETCPETCRPNFGPDQVRYMCQLKVGLRYKYVYRDGGGSVFTVVEAPFLSDNGWWVKVQWTRGSSHDISLHDAGVHPYPRGHWGVNHIAFTDESRHLQYNPQHITCCCYCPHNHLRGHHHNCC